MLNLKNLPSLALLSTLSALAIGCSTSRHSQIKGKWQFVNAVPREGSTSLAQVANALSSYLNRGSIEEYSADGGFKRFDAQGKLTDQGQFNFSDGMLERYIGSDTDRFQVSFDQDTSTFAYEPASDQSGVEALRFVRR